jgi:hypothetical protein
MKRRKKRCKSCKYLNEPEAQSCGSCGKKIKEGKPSKQAKPFARERKEFIIRMLDGKRPEVFALEMMAATKIFEIFLGHEDFLSKVAAPFPLKGSIKYLITEDGIGYLNKKKTEFYFKPKELDKIIDFKDKVGEDTLKKKTLTLREFLNG